ncbi:MAG: PilZ domain-containing protein [Candidatus Acidiferrales bacterium]
MREATDWQEMSAVANQDRRKEKRISISIPIEVSGFDNQNRFFSERTQTENISLNGCGFQLSKPAEVGETLAVRVASRGYADSLPKSPLLFRVERCVPRNEKWTIGATKLQTENIWCVGFPEQRNSRSSPK